MVIKAKLIKIKNYLLMVEKWGDNVVKGKEGEAIIKNYLTHQGYQVNTILSWNNEKTNTIFDNDHKEGTIFSPDFLVCNENEIFFAESKKKSHAGTLGWINKEDYDKYYNAMKNRDMGFKLYWVVERGREIYVLDALADPATFPPAEPSNSDGRMTYKVPKDCLKLCGSF